MDSRIFFLERRNGTTRLSPDCCPRVPTSMPPLDRGNAAIYLLSVPPRPLPRSRWLGFTSTDWLEIFIAEVLCYCYFNPVTSLETFCLRVREDILFHCEYRSHLPHGLFPSTLTTQCNLSLVRRAANWRASFVTLRGRLVLPQSLPPSLALPGDSSMPPLTSRRATTTALRAPP